MKRYVWLLLILVCAGAASAGQQYVSLSINEDTSVQQDVVLVLDDAPTHNQTVRYRVSQTPSSVSFLEGEARINDSENGTYVELRPASLRDNDTLQFSLRYGINSLVELTGTDGRVFSQTIYADNNSLSVTAALPRGYSLAAREPAASPEPEAINTDGQRIRLVWVRPDAQELSVIVIYQSANNWLAILLVGAALSVAAFFGLRFYRKKQSREALLRALSEDERTVVQLLREGVEKQKEITNQTGWSKSKTSKVVRRLEEHGVVEKKPYFKTNKLRITSFWKE